MNKIKVVTHDGPFHPDEVFSVASLGLLYDGNITVERTRDEEIISDADIVVDVGMEYDLKKMRFDHHQEGGAGNRENGIPYSSFGLVWKQFGEKMCGDKEIAEDIDKRLVMYVDARDNGIEITKPTKEGYPFRYSLWDIIRLMRPQWDESSKENFDKSFLKATEFAKEILLGEIKRLKSDFSARDRVLSIYKESIDKRVIVIDPHAPWENVLNKFPEPLVVIYPSLTNSGDWCAKVVKDDPVVFTSDRISFPKEWAGKRDEDLENVSGVKGSVFAHRAGFLVVANSKEAIENLVKKALSLIGED